jgi:hypothetical protein
MAVPASWNDLLKLLTSMRSAPLVRVEGIGDGVGAFKQDMPFALPQ